MTIFSILLSALIVLVTVIDYLTRAALQSLRLPDGSPSVDERITRADLETSKICAEFCEAVYSRVEDLDVALSRHGFVVDQVITALDLSAVCVVLAKPGEVMFVWRGTNPTNRGQVRANAKFALTDYAFGKVHSGIAAELDMVLPAVRQAWRRHAKLQRSIVITGHSQGGALATLTAAHIVADGFYVSDLITFGSPRTGNAEFVDSIKRGIGNALRWRNNNDIVTIVPPISKGYRHIGVELHIWPEGVVTSSPGWFLRLIQRAKPLICGMLFNGFRDHRMSAYREKLTALKIKERSVA